MKMYYEPNSRITVGSVIFNNVNKVTITESVKELGDKATVVLPRNYKKIAGKGVLEFIATGDAVTIELGYNGKYFQEFTGFIDQIESSEPLVLHVDDAFYPLKRNNHVHAWESITLRDLLTYIAPDYTIDCPDVNLGAFQISNASSYRVLRELQKQYGFYSYIRNRVLTCQFAYDARGLGKEFTYEFGNNVKANSLKYHRKEDIEIRIKAIANQRNGKKLTYEVGSDEQNATVRTLNFGAISKSELKQAADAWYDKLSFDGYSGSITGFAYPHTHAGDTLKVIDSREPDREGKYLIEKSIITYSLTEGYQRENTLSFRV